jgi:hypothetical protein
MLGDIDRPQDALKSSPSLVLLDGGLNGIW